MTTDNATAVNDISRVVTIVDGPPDAQAWVDALIQNARTGLGNMPHLHPDIPAAQITLPDLWRAIEANFASGGETWPITVLGFPPLDGFGGGSSSAMRGGDGTPDDPNIGSASHNVLHALLGDFH
jgi:hypothetical protein